MSRSEQSHGAIRLAQPISSWLVVLVAVVVALASVAYVCLGTVTRKSRVTGITIPIGGSISINAQDVGVLVKTYVQEGDRINAGDPLFELSTLNHSEQGEITALVAQQLSARQLSIEAEERLRIVQTDEKKRELILRLDNIKSETSQLAQEIGLSIRRQKLAEDSVEKYQLLEKSGFVSTSQTQQKNEELIDVGARLSTLQRTSLQLQANKLALEAEYKRLGSSLAVELSQLERSRSSLKQELAENGSRKTKLILAPHGGRVTALTSHVGQSVNGGQVLATLIPSKTRSDTKFDGSKESDVEVFLYAPSRTVGFISDGQRVLIRYQAYPYQKFGLYRGTVASTSLTPFAPNELPSSLASTILSNAQQQINGFNTNEALYRIRVRLERQTIDANGHPIAIRPGMTLEADIVQDRRKIWEWIAEPIIAVIRR